MLQDISKDMIHYCSEVLSTHTLSLSSSTLISIRSETRTSPSVAILENVARVDSGNKMRIGQIASRGLIARQALVHQDPIQRMTHTPPSIRMAIWLCRMLSIGRLQLHKLLVATIPVFALIDWLRV